VTVPSRRVLTDRLRPLAQWLRRRRTRGGAAICGLGLVATVSYGAYRAVGVAQSHPYFALTTIDVDGNRWVDRNEILQSAGVSEGTSIWLAAPTQLRVRLLSHPRIERVAVRREFPNRLVIAVRERRPVAIVHLDQLQYVDRSGRIFGPLRDEDSRDLPLITGLEDEGSRDFVAIGVHRALRLSRLYERMSGVGTLSEIHVDRQAGVTVFPQRVAVAVVLGWGGWHEKLVRVARVLAAWEGQEGRLAAVNASFRDIVVVRLREEHQAPAGRAPKRSQRV